MNNKEKGIPSSDVPQKSQEEIIDTFSTEKDDIIKRKRTNKVQVKKREMYGGNKTTVNFTNLHYQKMNF